jgi:hypothetical protein
LSNQQKLIGRWDIQRPFPVDGEFSDDTLLELVALIRSNARGLNFGRAKFLTESMARYQ